MPSTVPMSNGWCNGCLSTCFTENLPLVVTSSTVSPTGVNSACCMTRMGATSAGLPRMYVAMGRPMLFEFKYSELSTPIVASGALRWKNNLLSTRKTSPTPTAEQNATMIVESNRCVMFSCARMANMRHGLAMKKLRRLNTYCAWAPPICRRAAA